MSTFVKTADCSAARVVVPRALSVDVMMKQVLPKLEALAKAKKTELVLQTDGDDRFVVDLRRIGIGLTVMPTDENPGVWVLTGGVLHRAKHFMFSIEEWFFSVFDALADTEGFCAMLVARLQGLRDDDQVLDDEYAKYEAREEAAADARRSKKRTRRIVREADAPNIAVIVDADDDEK